MKTPPRPRSPFTFVATACVILIAVSGLSPAAEPEIPFPPLSPEMPYDVDMAQKSALEKKQQFAHVQRLFDIYSWQTFIALNWPIDDQGKPQKSITAESRHFWETYIESFQVYKEDGSGPVNPNPPYDYGTVKGYPNDYAPERGERLLTMNFQKNIPARISSRKSRGVVADETLQAFSGPLIDQNGKWVRYEVLMNEPEYDYVVQNQFYNLDGQLLFSNAGKQVNFPSGMNKDGLNRPPLPEPKRGAMELKLSWKELGKGDIQSRFLRVKAMIEDADGSWHKKEMGLVGMHIAVKTESSPTWVWATFEHVDNVRINDFLADPGVDGNAPKAPSFYDPNQPTKTVNVLPTPTGKDASGNPTWDISKVTYPVQVTRVIPIPVAKEVLNSEVQGILGKAGSVLRYYELIDTQWPTGTDPKTGTSPLTPAVPPGTPINFNAPNAIANKAPGDITPTFLTNSTMETYFQTGNQPATNEEEGSSFDITPIFATESCTGCHYSAGIVTRSFKNASNANQAIFGASGNGDFSWLMAQKAKWLKSSKTAK